MKRVREVLDAGKRFLEDQGILRSSRHNVPRSRRGEIPEDVQTWAYGQTPITPPDEGLIVDEHTTAYPPGKYQPSDSKIVDEEK